MQDTITKPLLKWYGENKRVLPWREKKNPYEIWVSEIMLQQTRVEAVKPFYERFMRELPNVAPFAIIGVRSANCTNKQREVIQK